MKKLLCFVLGFWLITNIFHRPSLSPIEVEKRVVEYLGKDHPLVKVAPCESEYHQYNKYGDVYRGEVNPDDVGVFQINLYHHGKAARRLGYDVFTLKGNMAYAKYLYEHEGLKPWNSSSACWKKKLGVFSGIASSR